MGAIRAAITRASAWIAGVLLSTSVLVGFAFAASPSAAALTPVDVQRAAQYAAAQGTHAGIFILDTQTGAFWAGGDYLGNQFASESLIKMFIAARLLVTGQMVGSVQDVAWKMITQSDDDAANALYGRAGGDSLIDWVKAYYDIPTLGYRPSRPGWWGNTHVSARGLAYFLARAKADPTVGPWLLNAMHHATTYGSDGFYQQFGIPQAVTGAGIKQGWGGDDDNFNSTELNSTGYVGDDRYAVVLLAQHIPAIATTTVMATINQMARLAMPGGRVDNPADHNPIGHVDAFGAVGSTLTISGWTLDRDYGAKPISVSVYEGTRRLSYVSANQARPDVNRVTKIGGNHGFALRIVTRTGPHLFCVQFNNQGAGAGNTRTCYPIQVSGTPVGYFDGATIGQAGTARLAGWAFDPDATSVSGTVAVTDNGVPVARYPANRPRPDVNTVRRVTGQHGFVITLAGLKAGPHTFCVIAFNIGPASPIGNLGCRKAAIAVAVVDARKRSTKPTPDRPTPIPTPSGSATPTRAPTSSPTTRTPTRTPAPTSTARSPATLNPKPRSTPTSTASRASSTAQPTFAPPLSRGRPGR